MKISKVTKLIAYTLLLVASLYLSAYLRTELYIQALFNERTIPYTLLAFLPPIALVLCIFSLLLEDTRMEIKLRNPVSVKISTEKQGESENENQENRNNH
jgi:hypothetical protein